MRVLLRKEIRSLLPAWIMSIAAAALIAFVRPSGAPAALFVVGIGCVLLGITSFGSEFSQGTFSLLLAQPIPRGKIWWTKAMTLGAAMLSIAIIVLAVLFCRLRVSGVPVQVKDLEMPLILMLLLFGAAFAGGLLSALATRQMATAFWIALLSPLAICAAVGILTMNRSQNTINISFTASLAVYDLLAFLLARHQFIRVQDLPGASGKVISVPAWIRFGTKPRSVTSAPSRRPLRTLIIKEFQLHQVSLCFAAVLLVLHLIVLFIRRMIFVPGGRQIDLYELLGGWWLLWFVLPMIIASGAIAEERRQGTLEGSLCLPARRRAQWLIKCVVCFFLAVLFGGVMPWFLESAASLTGAPAPILESSSSFADHWHFLCFCATVAAVITLVAFYASSLSRNLLQAVGVAILVASVFSGFVVQLAGSNNYYNEDWFLSVLLGFGLPALFAVLLWLSYTNFKHLTVGPRLLLANGSALLFVCVVAVLFAHIRWV